jgi:3-oxoacyl-[acyl-carrier protein] reductase
MDLNIAGKRALVCGGSAGLGYSICEGLAAEGVNLLIFSRDPERLAQAREKLQQEYGIRVDTFAGDITREEDVDALARSATDTGGIQILVLNTPRPPHPMHDFLDETDSARWEQAHLLQLHSALLVLRKLTPLIIASGWGRVIAITSASVKQPMASHALSTIPRAGVHAALKHLSMEIAHTGVTVNAVAPATVETTAFRTNPKFDARVQSVPMKRAGKPEELAATVAFLASDLAGFITGATIQFDGGQTLSLL